MSKIICEVCGTTYPDTAECCPICGCTRDEAAGMMSDELMMDEMLAEPKAKNMRSGGKKREIFDFDEVNADTVETVREESNPYEEEEEFEEEPRQNTLAVVLLTALIAVLLIGAAFLFLRYYLPGITRGRETEPSAVTVPVVQTEAPATTELSIPCESLALLSGMAYGDSELINPGQKFLINVAASPKDTTDKITYTSEDESVATVSEDGQVVAVGEGETVINITCGSIQLPCKVVCNFSKETEPPTEATTEPTATEAPTRPAVELKLKKTDIMLKVYYETQLMLDCDLGQNEVEWSVEHAHIAKVDNEGNVTALKSGTTSVIAKYGDQEVSCIVRCYN